MLPKDKRKLALLIGAGTLLVAFCTAVVMIIDARLDVDFGTDSSAGLLFYFIAGCIFLPRALRGYRAGRREEPKVAWYGRSDLILCLMGLISGLIFTLSVVRNWMEFIFINNLDLPQSTILRLGQEIEILDAATLVMYIFWGAPIVVLIYQAIKRSGIVGKSRDGRVG